MEKAIELSGFLYRFAIRKQKFFYQVPREYVKWYGEKFREYYLEAKCEKTRHFTSFQVLLLIVTNCEVLCFQFQTKLCKER